MKPVNLPSRQFRTKKEAKSYFRRIHNDLYKPGEVVSDPEHDQLLRELVKLHPAVEEKEGPGIHQFFVERTSASGRRFVGTDLTGIWIRDVAGDERDFSYNTAIDQPDGAHVVREALRNEVNEPRMSYRDSAFASGTPVRCPETGIEMTDRNQAEVRYGDPDWTELTAGFVAVNGGWSSIRTHRGAGEVQVGGLLVDPETRAAWIAYWKANADLRLVAKPAVRRAAGL